MHDSVYDELAAKVVEFTGDITLGDPFDPSTGMGPVVSRAAQERILGMIERAQADGRASCSSAAAPPVATSPTASTSSRPCSATSRPDSELGQVEVFGPVLSLMRFHDRGRGAGRSPTAPSTASRPTSGRNDVGRINRLASRLEAGGVYVNGASPVVGCELPFGGVGISGFGREGGLEGLLEFVRTKAVAIA